MKFGEFTARLSPYIETICVKIEGEPGDSSINPFGTISDALQDYDVMKISIGDDEICLTLKKEAGE